jgi:hypothetical protein
MRLAPDWTNDFGPFTRPQSCEGVAGVFTAEFTGMTTITVMIAYLLS